MMRKLLTLLLFCPLVLWAQRPFINSISPTHIEVGQKVTITGSNLTNANRVFFGGVSVSGANISVTSDNLMTAIVPAGSTHGSIIVQTSDNLVAESPQKFFISFSGTSPSAWKAEYLESLGPQSDAYDICLCDLDGDNQNDVIISHNSSSGIEATVLENQSTFNNESFNEISIADNTDNLTGFIASTCADLDNDGDKDVIFTTNDGTNIKHIYIYRNNGGSPISLTYLGGLNLKLPNDGNGDNRVPRRVKVSDIDGDGKPDLVVGNENDNTFHIFPNTTSGSISFGSPTEITVGDATSTGAIDIGDLNNDGKPDVVIIPAVKSNERIYVLKNQSIQGDISFSNQAGISSLDLRRNLVIGDFNNDGLNDIAATADRTLASVSGNETVSVYQNTTSGSEITFSTAATIIIPSNQPWGIDAGDLNGDGLLDIAVACTGGNVYTIENTTSGSISFATPTVRSTQINARNIRIGDLDLDARPDLAYTHNVNNLQVGDLGVRLNQTCIVPVISPSDLEFCNNDPFTLTATKSALGVYSWEIISGSGADPADTDSEANFTIPTGSTATVRVTLTLGSCAEQGTADFTLIGGTQPTPPTFGADEAICPGDDYTITASGGPFSEYVWTRPDGTSVTTAVGTLDITNASISDAGGYTVRAKPSTGCYSEESATFNLEVSSPPTLEITNNNLDNFCTGTSVTLQVPDYTSDFTYQWQRDGANLTGENGNSITANQSGNYTVEVTDANTCLTETAAYQINEVSAPSSAIDGPTETCLNFETAFDATSTGQSGFTLTYSWQVDGSPVSPTDPTQLLASFTTAGDHSVTLTTAYSSSEVVSCSDVEVFNITVSNPPTLTFNESSGVEKCQGETITISVTNSNISSYSWSLLNAADNSVITIPSTTDSLSADFVVPVLTNIDEVEVQVDVVTNINCTVQSSINVVNYPSNLDIELSDGSTPDVVTLDEDNFVNLSAVSSITNPRWRPNDIISDSTATSVTVFPNQPSTIVTLIGTDDNGCAVSSEIEIILDNLRPKRTFSPNGDGMNDCWEILNSSQPNTQGCKVYIFDSRGKNIKVADAPFTNNCVWDGNFNGSPVPEGIYYYVFKCGDAQMSKSGSILLAR